MMLFAVRAVDLAIFGTLGSLWIVGALVIFFVWRWVIRQERATASGDKPTAALAQDSAVPMPRRGKKAERIAQSLPMYPTEMAVK